MCSTCNYKNYEENNGKLEGKLGIGNLVIKCDTKGKNYKIGIKDDERSDFCLYRCPTCGRKLF